MKLLLEQTVFLNTVKCDVIILERDVIAVKCDVRASLWLSFVLRDCKTLFDWILFSKHCCNFGSFRPILEQLPAIFSIPKI